jgi:hypothetical protein
LIIASKIGRLFIDKRESIRDRKGGAADYGLRTTDCGCGLRAAVRIWINEENTFLNYCGILPNGRRTNYSIFLTLPGTILELIPVQFFVTRVAGVVFGVEMVIVGVGRR